MKLSFLQWLWLAAALLFFGALLVDIAGLARIPSLLIAAGAVAVLALSVAVGPSVKGLTWRKRRG